MPFKVEQDVTIKVSTTDGAMVGCVYVPDGASTSEPLPMKASDFKGYTCDGAAGEKR